MSNTLPSAFALYPLGLSGIALIWLFGAIEQSRSGLLMHTLASGSVIVFVFLTGSWIFTSYYLRFVALGLFMGAALFICRRNSRNKSSKVASPYLRNLLSTITAAIFSALSALAVAARYPSTEFVDLAFPLRNGTYSVLQGGSNVVANPFHSLSHNPLAIDLVKLNRYGNRASGIAPSQLLEYEIFGEVLHSPCSGTLLAMRDGMPDNAPGTVDLMHTEGNFLIIDCGEAQILMAHLKAGSVLVSTGQEVVEGQPVGRVGNSGNTMEPHLHIEASREGQPISPRFYGRFLVINDLIRP
jgi:hypothetical protein